MEFKIIYEDRDLLAIEKPPAFVVFPEDKTTKEKTLIDYLLEKFPELKNVGDAPRYGIVHRLDKNTSGILLVAKNNQSLIFFQNQFEKREITKKYTALVIGTLGKDSGTIETLMGRSPQNRLKQKVYLPNEPGSETGKREAITEYRILEKLEGYTLVEVIPKTGRKHQIRVHLSYLGHPIAGDNLYGFKNQPCPKGLKRQFLHATYLKIKLTNGLEKELKSNLPEDLAEVIRSIKS
jgi:23S rRNA pseudouridine1911/1915/1917 synthase